MTRRPAGLTVPRGGRKGPTLSADSRLKLFPMTDFQKPLWRRFLIFVLPLMLSNILQSLSGTINSIFIGQMIGVEALASASTFFPIMLLFIGFIVGLASGATVLIGQAWGAKNLLKIKEVLGTTLTASAIAGLVVAALGYVFARNVMEVLGASPEIIDNATAYARTVLLGMPFFFVFLTLTSMLRGIGDTTTPLIALILSIGIGLVVTPALIEGWWGLPQIGVLAAAAAFILSTVASLIFCTAYLSWRKSPVAIDREQARHFRIDAKLLGLILRLGIPAGVAMIVASLAGLVVLGIVNRFGAEATAAFGAVNQVVSYVQFPSISVSIASAIFAAQAIGARRMNEVEHVTRTGLMMNLFITGGLVLIAYLFSEHLVRLFITSEEVVLVTETLLQIVLWAIVINGFAGVLSAVMRASGDVWIPMALTLVAIVCIEVPAALILSRMIGLNGIWIGYCLSFCTVLVLQAAYYLLVWRKKEITALV
jgi:putative MATE family efflux protein